jgi:hypothetical protein
MTEKKRSKICAEVTDESTPQSSIMTDDFDRYLAEQGYEYYHPVILALEKGVTFESEEERRLKATGLGKELF